MSKKKTIEETYKKLTQREHILHRNGMYIGDTKKHIEDLWVFNTSSTKMEKKMVEYSPGFLKIFDEVLTNATDHSSRDDTVTNIKVDFDVSTGVISVYNNGLGVPVVLHKEHGIYVPELIFGHLLSGSNYDDNDKRTGSGTNGIGIKVVNIFSKSFIIETIDSKEGLKFVQEHTENMSEKSKAKITKNAGKSYTKITFLPDYAKFNMKSLDKDTVSLITKRVYDCIACTNQNVSVYLNGEKLKGKGLSDYTKYFFEDSKIFCESVTIGGFIWEYAIVPYNNFEHVSFVNGNATVLGGKHVDYIMYQIINKLKALLETKKKLKDVKPNFIKDKLFLFLRATVVNPTFNSQTKEQLTTQSKDFGCSITVSESFINKLFKSSITEEIVEFCKLKEQSTLAKNTDGKKVSKIFIPKLEDALWAGTTKSNQCTLILTEGLSALTFALHGRSVVGPEKYGAFPLRGKCISEDTKIPLFNGEIKLAKDIQIGDVLIGDDGNERNVLTLHKDNGKMYEIEQDRGESYKVNDEHILTLCMPKHKTIYWIPSNYNWRTIYWDKETKNIKAKEINALIKIQCKECKIMINSKCLKRHYTRKHKNIEYVPYKLEDKDMSDPEIIKARKRLEEFLLNIDNNNIIDINIKDYFNVTKSLKPQLKGIRGECVNWEQKDVLLDPYVLGLWLGDGMKSGYAYSCDGKNDYELIDYLTNWGLKNDANIKISGKSKFTYNFSSINNFRNSGKAPLKKILSMYNLINNKHIPKEYLINSKEIRLKLLAGIIDTDGYITPDGTIEVSQTTKHKRFVDDIVYLSRSLGFYTHLKKKITNYTYVKSGKKAEAYIIKISGDTKKIPTILPRKKSISTQYSMRNSTGPIKIKSIEDENYMGIGIDGNNRFLINDFTVTHNCLNVRDASVSQLINNEEINSIKQIIGLKQDRVYKDVSELRYGKVMILTDADIDGSHIKSLLINLFHYWWPNLLKMEPNYIQTLKTPIVKAIKGKKIVEFFTEQDYIKWKETGINLNSYKIKYFKGLGSSTKEDAKDIFKRYNELKVDYYYKDKVCEDSILLAFQKDKNIKTKIKNKDTESDDSAITEVIKCTDRRKNWLGNYDKNLYVDVKENRVSYQDLINKELIHFSIYDNLRSIPSLCDGLKPSQRKILYYMLKKNITNVIKVAQLSGYVSAETGYHHGEASLQGAIIGMAQNFVGSNNINLLFPDGNMGTRYVLGKDASSPRYIFTRLETITPILFNSYDTPLLDILYDNSTPIEPEWYLPIIPMILVNGCEGIGTGYSTSIPSYNPKDIITNIVKMIDDEDFQPHDMTPYFRGFNGIVEKVEENEGSYVTKGKWQKLSDRQITITELPVGMGVTTYKEFLESLISGNVKKITDKNDKKVKKNKFELKDVQNKTKDENNDICFIVEFNNKNDLDTLVKSGTLEKELKLVKSFSTNNMYLFNEKLILTKYDNTGEILSEFFDIRLEYYGKRKMYITKKLKKELIILESKARFIKEYIEKKLDINKKSKEYIVKLLEEKKYPVYGDDDNDNETKDYDYLLRMPLYSLTLEKIEELNKNCENKKEQLLFIKSKTPEQLWKIDLEELKKYI